MANTSPSPITMTFSTPATSNISYMPLLSTGADMSKARWQQFGVSQLGNIATQAAEGTQEPNTISVFKEPLRAYQTVFSKALRLIGNYTGLLVAIRKFCNA